MGLAGDHGTFFCAVASSGCQKISPITDLLCISLLFLLFAFLCIAACLLQISFVCGDRQMVCNEWVTEQLKNFRNNFYFLSELQKSP